MVFIISVACLIVGCIAGFALFRYVATGKYRQIIEEASKEAEVIKEKKLYGKPVRGIERSTFVIDRQGAIKREWRGIKALGHAQEVLDVVKTL